MFINLCNADLVLVGAGCPYSVQSHLSVKSRVSVCKLYSADLLVGAGCSFLVQSHLSVKSRVSVYKFV